MIDRRLAVHDWLVQQEGAPYVWAAKGGLYADVKPKVKLVPAYDCSGLVTAALLAVGGPDWRAFHGCGKLFTELQPTDEPMPMDLVFYGAPGHVSHVMFWWGDGRVFGASGGNASTTSVAIARRIQARVQFKPKVDYRPDVRGFRRLPVF